MSPRAWYTQKAPKIIEIIIFNGSRGEPLGRIILLIESERAARSAKKFAGLGLQAIPKDNYLRPD